uniref:Protein kinase domain-containing protein n=1 Tax=viral metagenome TaxID=1070528 RepID=A0A6C0D6L2_9ZZZZ
MEGGKLIGQATYGCVFNPPLLCRKRAFPKSSVGKITEQKDAERETKATEVLRKIKEFDDYFVLPEAICNPRIESSQTEKDLSKCKILKEVPLSNLKQISMPFGGVDLHKYQLLSNQSLSFFTLMKHLLEAGALMVVHGFVHYDIHSGNILVDKFGIPRLIDFGQSFSVADISLESIANRWKVLSPEFSIEPIEVTFLTALDEFNKYSFEEVIKEVMPKKTILYDIEKLLGLGVRDQILNLAKALRTSNAFIQKDLVKFWKLYYPGYDSWSIGVILLEYLKRHMFSYEFIESSEWKLKRVLVVDVLRRMLTANPKERIDCMEALSMFDPVNEIYNDYGTEWVATRLKTRMKN